jgi:hypothetical protein
MKVSSTILAITSASKRTLKRVSDRLWIHIPEFQVDEVESFKPAEEKYVE